MERLNVLIVGGGLQALSCGESLFSKHSVDIITKDLQCKKSRFFNKVFQQDLSDSVLNSILEGKHYDILIPVSDLYVPFISKNKNRIEKVYRVKCAAPDCSKLSLVENKNRFMAFCKEKGIPHPKTFTLSENNIKEASEAIGFPSLIKPDFSGGARGITRVDCQDDLERFARRIIAQYGTCTLQELVLNTDYYFNVMMYRNKEGEILAYCIIKIVRMFPIGAGSSTCCVSIDNKELFDICADALKEIEWVGMADFDVLQRLDTHEYKIIEINPRVPASLRAAAISGVNFPELIVQDTVGTNEIRCSDTYTTGKILRYLGTDILWLMKTRKPFRNTPSWWKFYGNEIYYQDIYLTDPSTWWTWLADGIIKLRKRNKKLR